MSKIISIINYKGGVGKTTIALNLALGISHLYRKKVLLLDLDPQCSLSISCLTEYDWIQHIEEKGSIISLLHSYYTGKTRIEQEWLIPIKQDQNVFLLPGHLNLPEYEMKLVYSQPLYLSTKEFEYSRFFILSKTLSELRPYFDFIILDCPPNIYMLSRNAILSSDYYMIPTIPDFVSSFGIPFIYKHIEDFINSWNHKAILLGIILNRVKIHKNHLVKEHRYEYENLKKRFGSKVIEHFISDRILISGLMRKKINIFIQQAKKYENVRKELIEFINAVLEKMDFFS